MKTSRKITVIFFLVLFSFFAKEIAFAQEYSSETNNGITGPIDQETIAPDDYTGPLYDTSGADPDPSTSTASGIQEGDGREYENTASPSASQAPTGTSAQGGGYMNQEKIPGKEQTNDFPTYLKQIINFGFATIGILALFMIVIGAYQYLMAAGNIGKTDSAKETISSAFFGLILGLCAWLILYIISPNLLTFDLSKIESLSAKTASTPNSTPASNYTGTVPFTMTARIEKYDQYVKEASEKYGVPANVIRAIIQKESQWNPEVIGKSDPNDKGMMQINQKYHPEFFASNDWKDPKANILYGTKLLKEGFDGSWENAAAKFNRGNSWQDSRGQAYAADFSNVKKAYENSGYK